MSHGCGLTVHSQRPKPSRTLLFASDVRFSDGEASIIVEPQSASYLAEVKPYDHPALKEISLADVMQALADPCRLAIVRALLGARGRELSCTDIPLQVGKATRSHHFEVLRDAGLITSRCAGTKCLTSLRRRDLDRRFPGLLRLIARREN